MYPEKLKKLQWMPTAYRGNHVVTSLIVLRNTDDGNLHYDEET